MKSRGSMKHDRGMRSETIEMIFQISKKDHAFEEIEKFCSHLTLQKLVSELVQVGIMPEIFEHDSSEEKLWSKFLDLMLANSLNHLGLKSNVFRTRGNSADVFSVGRGYTLVSDARRN